MRGQILRSVVSTLPLLGLLVSDVAAISDEAHFAPNYEPMLVLKRTEAVITIDGNLNDPGWLNATRAANFAEFDPGDQTESPVETEVLVTFDDDFLYVAFLCYDDPSSVPA